VQHSTNFPGPSRGVDSGGRFGFSSKTLRQICGCAVGTIKSRVNRAAIETHALLYVEGAEISARRNGARGDCGSGS